MYKPTFADRIAELRFYKYNPHSIPGVRQLLCKMGRHDYEAVGVDSDRCVLLRCFYCERPKRSHLPPAATAGIMLVVHNGFILAISRRHDKTIFGLPGGKSDTGVGDENPMDTAIRETLEETSVKVKKCTFIYKRVEVGDGANKRDFESYCYFAEECEGLPQSSEEGEVKWLTAEELTSTRSAFGDYNRRMLNTFKIKFPHVYLIGE